MKVQWSIYCSFGQKTGKLFNNKIIKFLVIKPMDPDPHWSKIWYGIRIETNADPQHWLGSSYNTVLNRVGNFTSGIKNGGGNGQLGLEVRVFVLQGLEKFSNFINFVLWRADTTDSTLGLKLNINLLLIEKQCIKITKLQRFILYFSDPVTG